MINIFEKYNRLTDEEKEDIEDLYIVHQLYKQLEEQKELHPTKLELRILFEKIKECLDLSNIKVEEIIKRIVEILKCVDKTIYDIEDFLISISEEDLYSGPEKDRDRPDEEVFIFLKEILPGIQLYVKIKKDSRVAYDRIKILSCHEALY